MERPSLHHHSTPLNIAKSRNYQCILHRSHWLRIFNILRDTLVITFMPCGHPQGIFLWLPSKCRYLYVFPAYDAVYIDNSRPRSYPDPSEHGTFHRTHNTIRRCVSSRPHLQFNKTKKGVQYHRRYCHNKL